MVDRVEELGKVDVHGNTVALPDVLPYLTDIVFRRTTGTESET
jgi:hypothetical protein